MRITQLWPEVWIFCLRLRLVDQSIHKYWTRNSNPDRTGESPQANFRSHLATRSKISYLNCVNPGSVPSITISIFIV